jgi:hypothetical protein
LIVFEHKRLDEFNKFCDQIFIEIIDLRFDPVFENNDDFDLDRLAFFLGKIIRKSKECFRNIFLLVGGVMEGKKKKTFVTFFIFWEALYLFLRLS